MQYNNILTAMALPIILGASALGESPAMEQMRKEFPQLRTMEQMGKPYKIVHKQLATGRTPIASAENFIETFSAALEVDANEFIQRGPFEDGHVEQEIMYIPETGEHKFTGVYYMQTANGLPVYGSRLMVLVRNVKHFPAVSATTDLRDVVGFIAPKRLVASEAVALMAAATHLGRGATVTSPEIMVFAGTEHAAHEPTAALVFEASVGGPWDMATFKKVELVVDARTGEVLHEVNQILEFVDGNVSGLATESSGADVCEDESSAGLPYAKVTMGSTSVFADENGDYSISGSGDLISRLDGKFFNVNHLQGVDSSLTQNSIDPNFLHNEDNDDEFYRAEVNAYLQANIVRDFTLSYAPSYPTIANQLSFLVEVNHTSVCNAYYMGDRIRFFNAGSGCSNTAFSVIVHHEYGHHLVQVAGSGQGQYGEGMGDVMAVLITGDNELARGFYSNDCNNGIRNADNNKQYPCSDGSHECGQLISGCVWDTLEAMEASFGNEAVDIVSSLAINSIMMHAGETISPSITMDWLVLDDDDGDLENGTPHCAEIQAGFAEHGMAVLDMECPEINPLITIDYPQGKPSLIDPYGGTWVAVNFLSGTTEPAPDSGNLHLSVHGGAWEEIPLVPATESDYVAVFPYLECEETIEWYISVDTVDGDVVESPSNAPENTWSADVFSGRDTVFFDNFQTNMGWLAISGAEEGNWQRGIPSGNGDQCDPSTDVSGSGYCFLTGNNYHEDVDNGMTMLYSPTVMVDMDKAPTVSYYRWYNNGTNCDGASAEEDAMFVDITLDNGNTFTLLEVVGPEGEDAQGGWRFVEFNLTDFLDETGEIELRVLFTVSDDDMPSIVEAGVDNVTFTDAYCGDPTACYLADVNKDGGVGVTDLLMVIDQWGTDGIADINSDGTVDVSDLLAIVDAWGPCT